MKTIRMLCISFIKAGEETQFTIEQSYSDEKMASTSSTPQYDAVIVGSGFGGCYTLHKLRRAGFKCLVIDDAADLGGVWYWNCYAGARVDTPVPLYEFSMETIWRDWSWSQKYPGVQEIRRYFAHVESKLHLKKDILFRTRVIAANFDISENCWSIKAHDGTVRTASYFILCTGFAAKPYVPAFPGLDTFSGISCHTSKWPQSGIDFAGKRVESCWKWIQRSRKSYRR